MRARQPYRQLIVWCLAVCVMFAVPSAAVAEEGTSTSEKRLLEAYEVLKSRHVDAPTEADLTDAAIEGMVNSLDDPYTEYFSQQELTGFTSSINQTYIGIGVRLGVTADSYYIDEIFPGSSAIEEDVRTGDVIVRVNGEIVQGWELEKVTGTIKGEEGSTVKLMLQREGKQHEVELTRKQVAIPVVTTKRLDDRTGYIQLTTFSTDAGSHMEQAIQGLQRERMDTLVLDLRNNPGGYLQSALDIASLFIEEGILIHTRDREGKDQPLHIANGQKPSYKLIVLVNEGSASASEVLSGALQDHQAGTILGTKTYGKGSVQSIVNLDSGGAIKVTIQEYYTPNGRPVNKMGITPDVEVKDRVAQMITAMHVAGNSSLEVVLGQTATKIGQASFSDVVPVLNVAGGTFVPSRVLAAVVDAQVAWDDATASVTIGEGAAAAKFATSSPTVQYKQGVSYIELNAFAAAFPGMRWTAGAEGIKLTVTKGE